MLGAVRAYALDRLAAASEAPACRRRHLRWAVAEASELERLAGIGMLRLGPGGRALAALREPWGNNLAVAFLAGRGGALRELLMALRFEADADGSEHVTVNLPPGHPAEDDLRASGYDFDDAETNAFVYALTL